MTLGNFVVVVLLRGGGGGVGWFIEFGLYSLPWICLCHVKCHRYLFIEFVVLQSVSTFLSISQVPRGKQKYRMCFCIKSGFIFSQAEVINGSKVHFLLYLLCSFQPSDFTYQFTLRSDLCFKATDEMSRSFMC